MGAGLGGSDATRRGGWGSSSVPTTLAEINVTPLVDVMLVLLIVFMVSAPLMQEGIQVELPKANATAIDSIPEQIILSVRSSRQLYLGDHAVPAGNLVKKLNAMIASKPQLEVLIQADQSLNYGYIAQVMAEVKKAGIHRIGLVTQPGDTKVRL